jgi:hypothetical protein
MHTMSETDEQQAQVALALEPKPAANAGSGNVFHHIKLSDFWPHAYHLCFYQPECGFAAHGVSNEFAHYFLKVEALQHDSLRCKAKFSVYISFLCGTLLHLPLCFQNKVVCDVHADGDDLLSALLLNQKHVSRAFLVINRTIENPPPSTSCVSVEDESVTESHSFKIRELDY